MQEILFISDLHLSESSPHITDLFLQFVATRAPKADVLYILGDFFDAWVGDDDTSELSLTCIHALQRLRKNATDIYFMHGNRDFLVGDTFAEQSGARLQADPSVIDLFGTPTLIMHGDLLCTDDVKYQQARQMVRSAAWQSDFLSKDLAARKQLAEQYRQASGEHKSMEAKDIMDVDPQTVAQYMQTHHTHQLIHGHTHRPNVHTFELANAPATRYVLAQWQETGSVLCWTEQGPNVETITAR